MPGCNRSDSRRLARGCWRRPRHRPLPGCNRSDSRRLARGCPGPFCAVRCGDGSQARVRRATLATVLYQLKVSLKDVKPAVWRRVVVPADFTLFQLHEVIQVVMGWQDCHLHDFTIQRRRYAVPDPGDFDAHETADERKARLRQVVAPRSKFVYQYDFGDCWDHVVVVEDALDGDSDV